MPPYFPSVIKLCGVVFFVTIVMGIRWGDLSQAKAQISGQSTGICSDYQGNNFPCSDGGGNTGGTGTGGFGGCATSAQRQQAYQTGVSQINSDSLNNGGNRFYNEGAYAAAANYYEMAVNENPSNVQAQKNFGSALNQLGVSAWDRSDNVSARVYFERAVDAKPSSETIRNNLSRAINKAPTKSCSTCGKAIIADVSYGLNSSAYLSNYVHQATANYKNCTARLSCAGTDGDEFFKLMRSCLKVHGLSERGTKGCVGQTVSQFQ